MRVHPPASRLKIVDDGNRVSVEVPSKRNWFLILFLGFWLCGWLAGEIMVPMKFVGGDVPKSAALFSIAWLGGWTVGGAMAITIFAWNLGGRELVTCTRDQLSIRHDVRGLGFTRTYDTAHISRLRIDDRPINLFDPRMSLAFWGLGGGRVAFDYGSSTVRFGYQLDDPDANRLIDAFSRVHPQIKP
jgi:hypothetical protein